uniref:T6SS phospholipase effector Tle1-like catalytic domain-containing protein n=2 Tax=Metapseudomonas otitidis TaxID=319939 RepID=UPI0013F66A16
TETGITLRIGLFFDGTGNNLGNSALTAQCQRDDRELYDAQSLDSLVDHCKRYGFKDMSPEGLFETAPDNSYGNAASNVALLYDLYIDNAADQMPADSQRGAIKVYVEGIGTQSEGRDNLYSQATGQGSSGVTARVRQSPILIEEQIKFFQDTNPDAKIRTLEFDIFGFSRGAASARHFANEVLKPGGGVLAQVLGPARLGLPADFDWARDVQINFIGLFDTVAAINAPTKGDFSVNDYNPGVNLYLPADCARKVLHITARDEKRWQFALNRVFPGHEELALPGVHSNIGGGYRPQQQERLLLTKPEVTVVTPRRPLEHSPAWQRALKEADRLMGRGLPGSGELRPIAWRAAQPKHERGMVPSERWMVAVAMDRKVYGDLSKVALRAMHEAAVKFEVPFEPLEDDPRFVLPKDLAPIAEKLLAYARGASNRLTHEEERHLLGRYIHTSAHWVPTAGLLLNKPANQRLAYNQRPQEGYPE